MIPRTLFYYLRLLLISLILIPIVPCIAQEVRIFTNSAGVEIEAKFLGFVGDAHVTISRTSDGMEFELPVSSLSLGDQQYLAGIREKFEARAAGEADGTLVIRFPGHGGFLHLNSRQRYFGDSSREIHVNIPAGNWIDFRPSLGAGQIFIPYFGETEWTFEYGENDTFWLTRGSGDKELIGIQLPYYFDGEKNDHRERLRDIDFGKVKHIFNVSTSRAEDLEIVSTLPEEIPLGLIAKRDMPRSTLRKLMRENLVALSARMAASDVKTLETLPDLECLDISGTDPKPDDICTLPDFPKLKHLALSGVVNNMRWDETLSKVPGLRFLATSSSAKSESNSGTPITNFHSNPFLNSLILGNFGGSYFDFGALRTAPGLRILKIGDSGLVSPPADFTPMTDLKSLISLDLALDEFPIETLDSWFESGNLSGLRHYRNAQIPLFEHSPELEQVEILVTEQTGSDRDFTRFSTTPNTLRNLSVWDLSPEDARNIRLSSMENIHELELISTEVESPEFIYQFKNLTRLQLSEKDGSIDEIDLMRFPNLRSVSLSNMNSLNSVSNTAAHPELRSISLYSNEMLSDLGNPTANSTLEQLHFTQLPALKNLEGLSQATGITQFRIIDCDSLTKVDTIKANNQLERLSIMGCEQLQSESIRPD